MVALVGCTIVVPFWCLSRHVVVIVWLTNVEMVIPNLSWKQKVYGNIVVTVASRSALLVVVVCVCVYMLWGEGDEHDSCDGGEVIVLLVFCSEWRW